MYEIYEGDFLLFTTNDVEEADYYKIEGYIVRKVQCVILQIGIANSYQPGDPFTTGTLKKGTCFFDFQKLLVYNKM